MASRRATWGREAFRIACAAGPKGSFPYVEAHETAAELVALLNAEIRKQDACTGVSVEGITPVADERVATALRRSGGPVPGQCSRFFLVAATAIRCSTRGMI